MKIKNVNFTKKQKRFENTRREAEQAWPNSHRQMVKYLAH